MTSSLSGHDEPESCAVISYLSRQDGPFCEFMDLDFVSIHKHAKKELDQYPAILTLHLVNNPYLLTKIYTCTLYLWNDVLSDKS